MSVSIGVFTATAMFLAIGGDTEDAWGLQMYADDGLAACRTGAALVRHLRLIDVEFCMPTILLPLEILQDEKSLPQWVPSDDGRMKLQL